ncbi:hypothetical protein B4Q13_25675, partial [Lacticaseibacillus rhamnosus]
SVFAAVAVASSGCRSNCDTVESELRAREQDVRTLREEVERLEVTTHVLERQWAAVHGLPGPHGVVEKPSEPYPVRSLVVGRQTGGRVSDTCHGDDGLIVVIEPRARTVDAELLMESLFKLTELESRIPLNMNVLVKGRIPRVLGLAEALTEWLTHRLEVLLRRSNFR